MALRAHGQPGDPLEIVESPDCAWRRATLARYRCTRDDQKSRSRHTNRSYHGTSSVCLRESLTPVAARFTLAMTPVTLSRVSVEKCVSIAATGERSSCQANDRHRLPLHIPNCCAETPVS